MLSSLKYYQVQWCKNIYRCLQAPKTYQWKRLSKIPVWFVYCESISGQKELNVKRRQIWTHVHLEKEFTAATRAMLVGI